MKTNNKTVEIPILIAKATTLPLMGLNWVQRLGIHINTDNSEIKIRNIEMEDTGRKIAQLKNGFKDLLYNNKAKGQN